MILSCVIAADVGCVPRCSVYPTYLTDQNIEFQCAATSRLDRDIKMPFHETI